MTWSIKPKGSWGVATTTAPASELAAVLALPGSWPWFPYGNTALVRKDQWGSLVAGPEVDSVTPAGGPVGGGPGSPCRGRG